MARLQNNEIRARIEREEVKLLLDDRKFRRFAWRLLSKSGMFASSHRANPVDTSLAEGRRALGLEVLTELRMALPGALMVVLGEYPNGLPGYSTGEIEPPGDDDERDDPEQ